VLLLRNGCAPYIRVNGAGWRERVKEKSQSYSFSPAPAVSLYFLFYFFFSFRVLFPVVYSITQTQNKLFSSFLPSWCWRRNNMCERKKRSNNLLWGCLSLLYKKLNDGGGGRERKKKSWNDTEDVFIVWNEAPNGRSRSTHRQHGSNHSLRYRGGRDSLLYYYSLDRWIDSCESFGVHS
jgi:hypothetical protein